MDALKDKKISFIFSLALGILLTFSLTMCHKNPVDEMIPFEVDTVYCETSSSSPLYVMNSEVYGLLYWDYIQCGGILFWAKVLNAGYDAWCGFPVVRIYEPEVINGDSALHYISQVRGILTSYVYWDNMWPSDTIRCIPAERTAEALCFVPVNWYDHLQGVYVAWKFVQEGALPKKSDWQDLVLINPKQETGGENSLLH